MKSIAYAFAAGLIVALSLGAQAHAFAAGALAVIVPAVIALSSRKRLRAAARFLNTVADSNSENVGTDRTMSRRPAGTTTIVIDPQLDELTSALINLGTRKKAATAAAAQAITTHPAAPFDIRFRTAVQLLSN